MCNHWEIPTHLAPIKSHTQSTILIRNSNPFFFIHTSYSITLRLHSILNTITLIQFHRNLAKKIQLPFQCICTHCSFFTILFLNIFPILRNIKSNFLQINKCTKISQEIYIFFHYFFSRVQRNSFVFFSSIFYYQDFSGKMTRKFLFRLFFDLLDFPWIFLVLFRNLKRVFQ